MRFSSFLTAALMCTTAVPALAQEPEGRPPRGERPQMREREALSPEEAKAVWELQARSVSYGLDLSEGDADTLVEAYTEVRTGHAESLRAFRERMREQMQERIRERGGQEGGGPPTDRPRRRGGGEEGREGGPPADRPNNPFGAELREEMNKINVASRESLKKELSEIIGGDKLIKTLAILGSFNPGYDGMVHTVSGFNLGDEMTFVVLGPVEQYVVGSAKVIEKNRDDREALMEAMREVRTKFRDSLGKTGLSEEQVTAVVRASGLGRERGRRGFGGGA